MINPRAPAKQLAAFLPAARAWRARVPSSARVGRSTAASASWQWRLVANPPFPALRGRGF